MIDNDPSKSNRSIAMNMGVSEFLIRLVVHEDILYFLYKIRKGEFISQRTRGKSMLLSFWTISSILSCWTCFDFSKWENFLPGSDGELAEQPLACRVHMRYTNIDENQWVHIMVFVVVTSNGDIMHLFIFLYCLTLYTEFCIKCLEEVVLFWIERLAARRSYVYQSDFVLCQTSRRTQFWLS